MGVKYRFSNEETKDIINSYINELTPIYHISKKYGVDSSVIRRVLVNENIEVVSGSAFSVKYWVKRGLTETEAKKKVKTLKPTFTEFWLNLGYDYEEANLKARNFGDNTLESAIFNHGEVEGKRIWEEKLNKNIESNKKSSKRRIEYWTNQGFTECEAKIKVSEHQTTFSLDKCVKKYGEEHGLKIFNDRQKTWLKNFNKTKIENGGFNHDSFSVNTFKVRYGDNWKDKWVERMLNHYKNHELYLDIIKRVNNVDDFKLFLTENRGKVYNKKVRTSLYNSKLLQELLGVDEKELRFLVSEVLDGNYVKSEYGVLIRENGVLYRSLGEYELATFFNENGIEYIYEKRYPNSKKKCDFYINKSDLYIELTGMLNISDKRSSFDKIVRNYKNNLRKKMDMCLENGLQCLFLNNINDIKKIFKDG